MLKLNLYLPMALCSHSFLLKIERGIIDEYEKEVYYPAGAGNEKDNVRYKLQGDATLVKGVNGITIKDLDFARWLFGDNILRPLTMEDIKDVIDRLSKILDLPMDQAKVTSMIFWRDFVLQNPVKNYFRYLGMLKNADRIVMTKGLYYKIGKDEELAFYDPMAAMKRKERPEAYKDKNVLRYEIRYGHEFLSSPGALKITAHRLYDGDVFMFLVPAWQNYYKAIQKNNDIDLNFDKIKTKRNLYRVGDVSWLNTQGGEEKVMEHLRKNLKQGILTPKQFYDLKKEINEVSGDGENYTTGNKLAGELGGLIEAADIN